MQIIADLQLHSKYSRAVSPRMDLFEIASWASKKGIQLVATGDWQHPLWFREITTHLKEVNPGIYTLKKPPEDIKNPVYFLLSSEISSIYTQGKSRRVHNLVWSPSIHVCEKIIKALLGRGANLMSDGRPIVGISSKDLLKMLLEIDEHILLIPAHVWTPWYSIFGSMSGFDSIEECFGDLAKHVYAIETGLSSDPLMNWQIKELDNRSIVSFSDAHSGPKLGREATVLVPRDKDIRLQNIEYEDVANAIKRDPKGRLKIGYTIEFFPEEGKYHWDGHRACGIKYPPQETAQKGKICPVCKRPLTIGVESRVIDLAHHMFNMDRDTIKLQNSVGTTFVYDKDKKRVPYVSTVPLLEILTEIHNGSHAKASAQYEQLVSFFATEFDILLRKPYEEIKKHGGPRLEEAIRIMRERRVHVDPGYDGVFGTVHIFQNKDETKQEKNEQSTTAPPKQESLF